jgi:hypothetical protein
MEHEMSKGSGRRPSNLTEAEWTNRWDAIFGRDLDKKQATEDAMEELEKETQDDMPSMQ